MKPSRILVFLWSKISLCIKYSHVIIYRYLTFVQSRSIRRQRSFDSRIQYYCEIENTIPLVYNVILLPMSSLVDYVKTPYTVRLGFTNNSRSYRKLKNRFSGKCGDKFIIQFFLNHNAIHLIADGHFYKNCFWLLLHLAMFFIGYCIHAPWFYYNMHKCYMH